MPRPRQAVRFVLRLVACVAVGCLAAAGVAWGIVLYNPSLGPLTSRHVLMSGPDGRAYFYPSQRHGFGVETWDITVSGGNLPYPPLPSWITVPEPGARRTITTAYGWPFLCMTYHDVSYPSSSAIPATDSWIFQHTPNRYFKDWTYRFPRHILTLRFAANVAIFASALGALWSLPVFVRSFIRWRRGLCPSCGYDRRGLAQNANCPECGSVIAR